MTTLKEFLTAKIESKGLWWFCLAWMIIECEFAASYIVKAQYGFVAFHIFYALIHLSIFIRTDYPTNDRLLLMEEAYADIINHLAFCQTFNDMDKAFNMAMKFVDFHGTKGYKERFSEIIERYRDTGDYLLEKIHPEPTQ